MAPQYHRGDACGSGYRFFLSCEAVETFENAGKTDYPVAALE